MTSPDTKALIERLASTADVMESENPGRMGFNEVTPWPHDLRQAASELSRLLGEVEGLRSWVATPEGVDALPPEIGGYIRLVEANADRERDAALAAEAQLEGLREALEPFARAADEAEDGVDPKYAFPDHIPIANVTDDELTLGECRRARAALAAAQTGAKGEACSEPTPPVPS